MPRAFRSALLLLPAAFALPILVGATPALPDSTSAPGDQRSLYSLRIDSAEIRRYPVNSVAELIELQPGVVDGHMRGGRSGETGFYYGRIPINNPFFNRAALEIEPGMLSSLHVRPGVVDSRYGYGASGIVLMEPIPVPPTWMVSARGQAGLFSSSREMEFLQREGGAGSTLDLSDFEIDRIPFSDAVDRSAQRNLQLTAGGPLLGDRLGLMVGAYYRSTDGHMLGRRLFTPSDDIVAFSGRPRSEWIIRSSGDEEFVQFGGEDRLTLSGRASVRLLPELDLTYEAIYQDADLRPYDHNQKYVPDGVSRDHTSASLHAFQLTYGAGSSTRAWSHYALLSDGRSSRLFDSATDSRYVSQAPGNGANAFDVGGNDLWRFRTRVQTHMASIAGAHRIAGVHDVRGGVEARIHRIDRSEARVEVLPGIGPRLSQNPFMANHLEVTPTELSAFVGATVQIDRLTIDAGLRSSYFDPAAEIPIDWSQASSEFIPNFAGSFYYDPEQGDTIRNRQDAEMQSWLNPSIELSFPISDATTVRFGAGRMHQMAALQYLYDNPEFEMSVGQQMPQSVIFGDAALKPERTTHIEMGVEHRLTDRLNAELALFGKDSRDLTSYAYERDVQTRILIMRPINIDLVEVRGATVSVMTVDSEDERLSWSVDYSLLFVEGNASAVPDGMLRFISGLDDIKSMERLEWDRRHILHNAITFRPSPDLTITLLNRLQSPLPYKLAVTNRPEYVVAGDDTPVQLHSDVSVWYDVPVLHDGLRVFLQIDNLTDARIARSVLSDTGISTDLYRKGRRPIFDAEVEGVNTLQEYADDRFYLPPRTISLGLALEF
ncbi:MAG TPA: TonB-dependent receptor [Rhodothermales bacterium]